MNLNVNPKISKYSRENTIIKLIFYNINDLKQN